MGITTLARPAFSRFTRSRLAARLLFGGRPAALLPGEHYFDVTSLALRRLARSRIPRGARVLDVGTGSAAVLGLWLWRRGCRVTCTEIDPSIAARARESLRLNGAPIEVLEGSFLAGAAAEHDFVIFNPPYWPTAAGEAQRLPRTHRSQWDGGPDGMDAIRGFLGSFAAEGGRATALLGVHSLHVPRAKVERLLEARADLSHLETWKHPWLGVHVYVLVRRKSPSASESRPEEA